MCRGALHAPFPMKPGSVRLYSVKSIAYALLPKIQIGAIIIYSVKSIACAIFILQTAIDDQTSWRIAFSFGPIY